MKPTGKKKLELKNLSESVCVSVCLSAGKRKNGKENVPNRQRDANRRQMGEFALKRENRLTRGKLNM